MIHQNVNTMGTERQYRPVLPVMLLLIVFGCGIPTKAHAFIWLFELVELAEVASAVTIEEAVVATGTGAAIASAAGSAVADAAIDRTLIEAAKQSESKFLEKLTRNALKARDGVELFQRLVKISPDFPDLYLKHQNEIDAVFERENYEHRLMFTLGNDQYEKVDAIIQVVLKDLETGKTELAQAFRVETAGNEKHQFQLQLVKFAAPGVKRLEVSSSLGTLQASAGQTFFVI